VRCRCSRQVGNQPIIPAIQIGIVNIGLQRIGGRSIDPAARIQDAGPGHCRQETDADREVGHRRPRVGGNGISLHRIGLACSSASSVAGDAIDFSIQINCGRAQCWRSRGIQRCVGIGHGIIPVQAGGDVAAVRAINNVGERAVGDHCCSLSGRGQRCNCSPGCTVEFVGIRGHRAVADTAENVNV
jgi:hypothetical protein